MKQHRLPLVLLLMLLAAVAGAQSSAAVREYIANYHDAAIEEMKRTGVPAAITLAQGIHETEAGKSDLVLASNNHFGIKCKADWKGEYVVHDDDAKGEHFRKYDQAIDSYKDHSDFLKNSARYAFLFQLDPTDYQGWAWGLKKAGYATNPKYPQILIKLIEDYNLEDYTLVALGRKSLTGDQMMASTSAHATDEGTIVSGPAANPVAKQKTYPDGVFQINETAVVFAPKGTSYLALAQDHEISLKRLFDFNDMQPQELAATDVLIFLQRKRKKGANDFHKMVAGESLYEVAQSEGIRMESLLEYNYLKEGMQPQVGEVLYLHDKAPAIPKLITATQPVTNNTTATSNTDMALVKTPAAVSNQDAFVIHKVQPKETMYSIAKKYAVSINDVLKWNDLQSLSLKIGQELRINKIAANAAN